MNSGFTVRTDYIPTEKMDIHVKITAKDNGTLIGIADHRGFLRIGELLCLSPHEPVLDQNCRKSSEIVE